MTSPPKPKVDRYHPSRMEKQIKCNLPLPFGFGDFDDKDNAKKS